VQTVIRTSHAHRIASDHVHAAASSRVAGVPVGFTFALMLVMSHHETMQDISMA
jgi:hypothetical protein